MSRHRERNEQVFVFFPRFWGLDTYEYCYEYLPSTAFCCCTANSRGHATERGGRDLHPAVNKRTRLCRYECAGYVMLHVAVMGCSRFDFDFLLSFFVGMVSASKNENRS